MLLLSSQKESKVAAPDTEREISLGNLLSRAPGDAAWLAVSFMNAAIKLAVAVKHLAASQCVAIFNNSNPVGKSTTVQVSDLLL